MTENYLHNHIPSFITTVNKLRHILQDFSVHVRPHTHTYTHLLLKNWAYCYIVC